MHFQEQPIEILNIIFQYMQPQDLFSLRATNHFFNKLFNFMLEVCCKNYKKEFYLYINHLFENTPENAVIIKKDFLEAAIQHPTLSLQARLSSLSIFAQSREITLDIPDNFFTLISSRANGKQMQIKESAIEALSFILPFLSPEHCEKALKELVEVFLNSNGYPIETKALNALKQIIPRLNTQSISYLFNYITPKLNGGFFIDHNKLLSILIMLGGRLNIMQVGDLFNIITKKFINHEKWYIQKQAIDVLNTMVSIYSEAQLSQFVTIINDKLTEHTSYERRTIVGDAILALTKRLSASEIELFCNQILGVLQEETDETIRIFLLCYLLIIYPYLKSDSASLNIMRNELMSLFDEWRIIAVLPEYLVNSSSVEVLISMAIDELEKDKNEDVISFLLQIIPKAPNQFKDKLESLTLRQLEDFQPNDWDLLKACVFFNIQLKPNQVIKLIKDLFGAFSYFTYSQRKTLECLFSKLDSKAHSEVILFLEKEIDTEDSFYVRRAFDTLTLMTLSLLTEHAFNHLLNKAVLKLDNEKWDVRDSVLQFFIACADRFTNDQALKYLNYALEKLKDKARPVRKSALQLVSVLITKFADVSLLELIYKKITPLLGDEDSEVRLGAVSLLSSITCKNIVTLNPVQTDYSQYTLIQIFQGMWKQIKDAQPVSSIKIGLFDKNFSPNKLGTEEFINLCI